MENINTYPLVSIITVNYDQPQFTVDMIHSLKKCTYKNIEIIVIDNASPKTNPSIIKDTFPDIQLIKLPQNLGFAGGNNEGFRYAKGEFILLLNNDTEVEPGFLEPLVETLLNNKDAGMASPRLHFYHSPNMKTIQFAGAKKVNLLTGRGKNLGWGEMDNGQFNFVEKTDYAHGAALLLNRKVLDIVGCMPDIFFLYYEEHDWCTAMKKKGLYPYYVGTSVVYHKESATIGKNSPIKVFYMTRNRLIYLRRNAPVFQRIAAFAFFTFVSIPGGVFRLIKNKESHLIKWFFKAIFWNIKNMGSTQGFPKLVRETNGQFSLINTANMSNHATFIKNIKK